MEHNGPRVHAERASEELLEDGPCQGEAVEPCPGEECPAAARRESRRLRALDEYRLLEPGGEEGLKRLVRLACGISGTPYGFISVVGRDRQWLKTGIGVDLGSSPRATSFCAHTIKSDAALVVEDTRLDPRFASNPWTLPEEGRLPYRVLFYAGVPICVGGGHAVGTLCVTDEQPRRLSLEQIDALEDLAAAAADQFELRLAGSRLRQRERILSQTARMAHLGAWQLDVQSRGVVWSAEVYRIHGVDPSAPVSEALALSAYPPEAREKLAGMVEHAVTTGATFDVELPLQDAQGTERWVRLVGEPEVEGGRIVRLLGSVQDITDRRRIEVALRHEEARLRALFDTAADGIVLMDESCTIYRTNPALQRMFGYSQDELRGNSIDILMPPQAVKAHLKGFRRQLAACDAMKAAEVRRASGMRRDGSIFAIELSAGEIRLDGERLFVSFVRDITERVQAERQLRESEERFRSIGDSVPAIVWVTEPDGTCGYLNRRWYEYTGEPEDTRPARSLFTAVHPDDLRAVRKVNDEAMRALRPFRVEYRLRRQDGAWRWMMDAGTPRFDAQGTFLGYIGSIVDIDDRRQAEARIQHLAHHDGLTGLPNRVLLQDRLQQALVQAQRHGDQVGLLLLDLDRFKDVNDSLGHDAGDELLRILARRLRHCVREGDTVARLGGDEFAIVLPRLPGRATATRVAQDVLASLQEPVTYASARIHSGTSIGITIYPDDGHNAAHLLKNADIALYTAKAEHGGYHTFFAPEMRTALERRKEIEAELRQALANDEIVPYFQPKIRLRDGRTIGYEALARWQHPVRGLIPSDEFMPVAEETGLINLLSERILRQAVLLLNSMPAAMRGASVAVNVAGSQLRQPGFADRVHGILLERGLKPSQLVIEVTENVFLGARTDQVARELEALHRLGIIISLDDFGTGYASLTHLKRFPISELKIDRSFVNEMLSDPGNAAIVRAVIDLGKSLDLTVVAEGVESMAQAAQLRAYGCDHAQGYLFGTPADTDNVWLDISTSASGPNPYDVKALNDEGLLPF